MGTLVVYIGITVCIMVVVLFVFLFPCFFATIVSGLLIFEFGLGTTMPPKNFSAEFGSSLIIVAIVVDIVSFKWRTWWRD